MRWTSIMKIENKKILILSPHQDDEILSCYQVIKDAEYSNNDLFIVYVTNGDYFGEQENRYWETKRVFNKLKIKQNALIFMGYSDTGMQRSKSQIYNFYNSKDSNQVYSGKYGDYTYFPSDGKEFHYKQYGEHALYCKKSFEDDMKKIINFIDPDVIFFPHEQDFHADHSAVAKFVKMLKKKGSIKKDVVLLQYLIHGYNDLLWPNRVGDHYVKPDNMEEEYWNKRIVFEVSDLNEKKELIELYQSQKPNAARRFLFSFIKKEEIYWKLID